MIKQTIFAVTAFFLLFSISCKDSLRKCEEHELVLCDENPTMINIRLENISKFDFCNVSINTGSGVTNYGIIKRNEKTCYRSFDVADNNPYIRLIIGNDEFILESDSVLSTISLQSGYYKYRIDVLDFKDEELGVETVIE